MCVCVSLWAMRPWVIFTPFLVGSLLSILDGASPSRTTTVGVSRGPRPVPAQTVRGPSVPPPSPELPAWPHRPGRPRTPASPRLLEHLAPSPGSPPGPTSLSPTPWLLDLAAHPRSPVCFNCAQSQCHRSPVTAPIPVSRRTNRGSEGLKMAPRAPLTRHVQQLAAPAVRLLPAWLPPVLGPSPAPPPPAGSDQGCSSLPHCPPGPTPLAEAPPEPPGVTRAPHGAS